MRLFGRGSARSAGVALVVTCWAVCVVLAGGEVAVEVAVEVAGKEHMEVKMSDGASQWVPVPASIREGKIGGEGGKYAMRLLRSIDFPVERLIVVLNVQELAEPPWIKEAKELHPSLEVVKPKVNLGCAGGWNSVIESVPSAPYWFILNNDLEFPPGTLRQIAELVADDLAVGNHSADGSLPVFMRSFGLRGGTDNLPAFTLTRQAVAEVGLFDENYWPVYGEDEDYFSRLEIVGRGVHVRDETIVLVHGPEDWDSSTNGHYSGSEQFIAASDLEKDKESPDGALTLSNQLRAADNGKFFCLKFGPLDRPNCKALEYHAGGAGPYGVLGAEWTDWIMDPFRRLCSMGMGRFCGYDRRLLLQPWPP